MADFYFSKVIEFFLGFILNKAEWIEEAEGSDGADFVFVGGCWGPEIGASFRVKGAGSLGLLGRGEGGGAGEEGGEDEGLHCC